MADTENKTQNTDGVNTNAAPENHSNTSTTPVTNTGTTPTAAEPTPVIKKPTIKTPTQKKGKKISPMMFWIGCLLFLAIFVGGIFAALYAGIQNPGALNGIGMSAQSAKTLLMIIAWVFFGWLFIISFAFLGLNWYRLSKAKNSPKIRFIVGMVVSLIFLAVSIWVWAWAILKIKNINTEDVATDTLVIGYVNVYDSFNGNKLKQEWIEKPGITLVGPVEVSFKINKDIYNAVVGQRIGVNSIANITLSCGNAGKNVKEGQVVGWAGLIWGTSDWFDAPCLYTDKWDYKIQLIYDVVEKDTQQRVKQTIEAGIVRVQSAIKITNDGLPVKLNDDMSQLIGWDAPARIVFDAKEMFSDLKLAETRVIWDLDNDGLEEKTKENKAFFSYNYSEGKQYYITYRLPGNPLFPNYTYAFPLWILPSDVAICSISSEKNEDGSYTFNGTWPDGGIEIESTRFEVYNVSKESITQTTPTQNAQFNYTFADNDQYVVRLIYTTLGKKKGFCESDIINASNRNYNIKTTLTWKKPDASRFAALTATGVVSLKDNTITAMQAPFDILLRIDSIAPALPKNTSPTVLLNDQAMKAEKANLFTARIYGSKPQTIKIFVDDGNWNTAEKVWNITFNQEPLIGELITDKVTWVEPLTVGFDASTVTATQDGDEIIYYSWDFGDGDIKKNVTQSKLTHTYNFNTTSGEWVYKPKVTIQTKKWHTKTFAPSTPISVTRKSTQVSVLSTTHPTQVAKVWDSVWLIMQSDGFVKGIIWDFGDGEEGTSCEDRSCAEVAHTFSKPGTFVVRATVEYQWLPSATNTLKIKVE